jgi:hypothetical protein
VVPARRATVGSGQIVAERTAIARIPARLGVVIVLVAKYLKGPQCVCVVALDLQVEGAVIRTDLALCVDRCLVYAAFRRLKPVEVV